MEEKEEEEVKEAREREGGRERIKRGHKTGCRRKSRALRNMERKREKKKMGGRESK